MLNHDDLELGLERLLELVRHDAALTREFESSRAEFFAAPAARLLPGAERRHLEWFLLERPSATLGAVPAEAGRARTLAEGTPELAAGLAQSLAGAFEVTSLLAGEGLWVRDLFTLGEHPVLEAGASHDLAVGDLVVGRIFPAGGSAFLLSPAAAVYRSPELLAAVRADLAGMRAARRGVLRVQQLELERLFHASEALAARPPSSAEAAQRAREQLLALGLSNDRVARVLDTLRRARRAGEGQVVTEILNGLAFDTRVDLDSARLALSELWQSSAGPTAAEREAPAGESSTAAARSALEAFDRGRAEGRDLEQLFRELERDLGVADEDDGADEGAGEGTDDETDASVAGAPDFPGVVGAMVEEFLWELEREHGAARARGFEVLRLLGAYAQDVGVFEDLSAARVLDFAARWLLDESGLDRATPLEPVLDALEAFCRWAEERHGVPLWSSFEATLAELRSALPRHLALRASLQAGSGTGAFRVVRLERERAFLRDGDGREEELHLTPVQATNLAPGDLVRVARVQGELALGATYPGALATGLAAR
jgi:hypothetical protein